MRSNYVMPALATLAAMSLPQGSTQPTETPAPDDTNTQANLLLPKYEKDMNPPFVPTGILPPRNPGQSHTPSFLSMKSTNKFDAFTEGSKEQARKARRAALVTA